MTRKKRALKYIREKNNLRLGGRAWFTFKDSYGVIQEEATEHVKQEMERLTSLYKMSLTAAIAIGLEDDDFVRDLYTVKVMYQRVNL